MSTLITYTGDGTTTDWTFSFPYLADDYVTFTVLDAGNQNVTVNYTGELVSTSELRVTPAVPAGYTLTVLRDTAVQDDLFGFGAGGVMRPSDIAFAMKSVRDYSEEARYNNASNTSAIAAAASASLSASEADDSAASAAAAAASAAAALVSEGNAAASESTVAASAAAAATSETNAASSASAAATSASNAATSETNAASSATAAATSETNAAGSATAASNSASAAATSASDASTSASAASSSASTAQTAATNAQNALDSLNNRYLGAHASDSAVATYIASDSNITLDEGDLYFNTTDNKLFYYVTGSGWLPAAATNVIDMTSLDNAGDVTITSAATGDLLRWNGTTWVNYPDSNFATAAQGALADSATQPGDLATVATSGSYNDLANQPSLFDGDYNSLTNKPAPGATTGKAIAMAIVFG